MAEDAVNDHKACAGKDYIQKTFSINILLIQGVISVLNSAMTLLRRCRANASVTIQLFSHLFQHINKFCFNQLMSQPRYAGEPGWGGKMVNRLELLQTWAQGQGLELAAECHLVQLRQAGHLIMADKSTPDQVRLLSYVSFLMIELFRLQVCLLFVVI